MMNNFWSKIKKFFNTIFKKQKYLPQVDEKIKNNEKNIHYDNTISQLKMENLKNRGNKDIINIVEKNKNVIFNLTEDQLAIVQKCYEDEIKRVRLDIARLSEEEKNLRNQLKNAQDV